VHDDATHIAVEVNALSTGAAARRRTAMRSGASVSVAASFAIW